MGQLDTATVKIDAMCRNCWTQASQHVEGNCLFQPTALRVPSEALLRKFLRQLAAKRSSGGLTGTIQPVPCTHAEIWSKDQGQNIIVRVTLTVNREGEQTARNWHCGLKEYPK